MVEETLGARLLGTESVFQPIVVEGSDHRLRNAEKPANL
jgi:hypothetical protein